MDDTTQPRLRRVLTLGPLILYGLGVIVGAGIYVAIGAVMSRAGDAAPLSFLLAGVAAGLTGLCYAEFAGRFPGASGGVSYIRHGFRSDRLAGVAGAAVTIAIVVSSASIALGTAHYLRTFIILPEPILATPVVVLFVGVGIAGIRESVGIAATMGAIEILGLIAATVAGLVAAPDFDTSTMLPRTIHGWSGVVSGAFLAFFAFIGFETLANLAEEVRDPHRTLPRGIIGAVAASVLLYISVTAAVVWSDRTGAHPLLALFPGMGGRVFAIVGVIAVANGVLVQIVMLARLFYGMARRGQLPACLGTVHPATHTPWIATLLAGALVVLAVLTLPFERLLALSNLLTLGVFIFVDLALLRIKLRDGPGVAGRFTVARWVPAAAALLCPALIAAEAFG